MYRYNGVNKAIDDTLGRDTVGRNSRGHLGEGKSVGERKGLGARENTEGTGV